MVNNLNPNYLTGKILIASPSMIDSGFDKNIIYICEHSPDGAMGIILNQPIKEIYLPDILNQLNLKTINQLFDTHVYFGGPVDTSRGFILHSPDYQTPGTIKVGNQISLSSSKETLNSIANGKGPREFFIAFGYAGWSNGQLDQEIKENSWLHTEVDNNILWKCEDKKKWLECLSKIGITPSSYVNVTGSA